MVREYPSDPAGLFAPRTFPEMRDGWTAPDMSAVEAAEDGIYQAQVAMRAMKHELNERRDNMLTEAEQIALLDAYTETGR